MDDRKYAAEMLKFIDNSPCAAFAAHNAVKMLKAAGFEEYTGTAEKGKKYCISFNGTAVAAFITGGADSEVRIGAAHLDSPSVMIKPRCNIASEGNYVRLDSEIYGGAILSTWLDRPLGLAGRVMLRGSSPLADVRLYKSTEPLCIIPNCAPHLNKELNNGYVYNKQKDMLPLYSLDPKSDLLDRIAADLGVKKADILDFELYCYDMQAGCFIGDMVSVGRLDDLMMSYALLRAICKADTSHTAVVLLTDNEEVGSLSASGARSGMADIAMRAALGDNYRTRLKKAVAFSADLAHAVNPAHPELHEPLSRPYINKGIVLKRAANKSYSTDAASAAAFKYICAEAKLAYQDFVNPSDRPGGTTIGPMLSAALCIPTADIGAPIMAMHSIRELGGIKDASDSYKLFKALFEV